MGLITLTAPGGHRRSKSLTSSLGTNSAYNSENDEEHEGCTHTRTHCKASNLRNKLSHCRPVCGVCFPEERRGHRRTQSANSNQQNAFAVIDETLVVCLKCGEAFCGAGSPDNHAHAHFEKKRHALFCRADSLRCRCYSCDEEVLPTQFEAIDEATKIVSKLFSTKHGLLDEAIYKTQIEPANALTTPTMDSLHFVSSFRSTARTESWDYKIKGVVNIGNTCFFNAVVQCLSRSVPLYESCFAIKQTVGERSRVLPYHHKQNPKEITVLLSEDLGTLTTNFFTFLTDMHNRDIRGPIDPRVLLDAFSTKFARFRDYNEQQDSQELLRTFLDALEEDEDERAKQAILKNFGVNCTSLNDPEFVALDKNRQAEIRSYVHGYVPRITQVFRGALRSTVTCSVCSNKSSVVEDFLDISVPIHTANALPKQKNNPSTRFFRIPQKQNGKIRKGEKKKLKAALKAEQLAKRREEKYKKKSKSSGRRSPVGPKSQAPDYDSESLSSTPSHSRNTSATSHELLAQLALDNFPKGLLTVPGGDPTVRDSPTTFVVDCPLDNDGDGGECVNDNNNNNDNDNDSANKNDGGNDIDIDKDNANDNDNDDNTDVDGFEKVESMDAWMNPTDSPVVISIDDTDTDTGGDNMMTTVTIPKGAPARSELEYKSSYTPQEGECSVQASLAALFKSELLDGEDSYGCEACYKAQRNDLTDSQISTSSLSRMSGSEADGQSTEEDEGSDNSSTPSRSIRQTAKKTLGIQSTPQILTIHLKRFEQVGYRLTKVMKHVTFPTILDLAPFCDESVSMSVYDNGEVGVRYELYGVVEHTGKLSSGHYTAYIKDTLIATNNKTPSKWWVISDEVCQQCTEAEVLRAQAYLLFYERLY